MKRNTALFGASLVAGVAAAAGLVVTSSPSSAADSTYYGVAWSDATTGTSSGWTTGAYADPGIGGGAGGEFSGRASAGSGTFKGSTGSTLTVSAKCDNGDLVTTANGKSYQPGATTELSSLVGGNAIGTVTFGSKKLGGHTVGAYIDLTAPYGAGTYVALTGADCAAAPPTSSTTTSSSSTTPPPTSSTTAPPTSSTTAPPTSSTTAPPTSTTTAPPTSTTTAPPTSTTTAPPTSSTTAPPTSTTTATPTSTPPTTPPPTTEPPTPTPTTTTLPVTG